MYAPEVSCENPESEGMQQVGPFLNYPERNDRSISRAEFFFMFLTLCTIPRSATLQSIFTPYFAHVLTDCCDDMEAAGLLTRVEASGSPAAAKKKRKRAREEASSKRKRRKTLSSGDASDSDEESGEGDGEGEDTPELLWRRSAASRLVLSALRRCFQSDRSGFVNKARFELVLPAVVAQLECGSDFSAATAGGGADDEVSSCRLHAEELVGPCLAQLASASGKDALWKALANAVLMKTRSRRAGVRVAALVSLRQCFEVVGEEFLALLPECLPFLSELLEVRKRNRSCRKCR